MMNGAATARSWARDAPISDFLVKPYPLRCIAPAGLSPFFVIRLVGPVEARIEALEARCTEEGRNLDQKKRDRRVTRHERAVAAPFIMWMFDSGERPRAGGFGAQPSNHTPGPPDP